MDRRYFSRQSAVGVASRGFEFDRRYLLRVAGVQLGSAELLDGVGPARHPQHADLGSGVERRSASSHRCSRAGRTAIALALPVMIETTPPAAAQLA
jgi:hypothetical protein